MCEDLESFLKNEQAKSKRKFILWLALCGIITGTIGFIIFAAFYFAIRGLV